jgi:hypothetical protein
LALLQIVRYDPASRRVGDQTPQPSKLPMKEERTFWIAATSLWMASSALMLCFLLLR